AAVRRAGVTEYFTGSLRLDVGRADHVAPFRGFGCEVLSEIGRRPGEWNRTKVQKPSLELGIGEARVDFGIELLDYPARCAFGRANAIPSARLIARQKIANNRDVW